MRERILDLDGREEGNGKAAFGHLAVRLTALSRRRTSAGEAGVEQIRSALEALSGLLASPFPDLQAPLPQQLALALDALARLPQSAVRHKAFALAVRLGPFGAELARGLLDEGLIAPDEALEALAAASRAARDSAPHAYPTPGQTARLEPSVALLLTNQILLTADMQIRAATRLAFDLLPLAAEAGFGELRPFLRLIKDSDPGLAFPPREALWMGRLGRDLRALPAMDVSRQRLEEAVDWLELLTPETVPPALAKALAVRGEAGLACRLALACPGCALPLSLVLAQVRGSQVGTCLEAVARAVPSKAGAAWAMFYRGKPEMRPHLAGSLALLPAPAFTSLLENLPPAVRQKALNQTLDRVALMDPPGLLEAARLGGASELAALLASSAPLSPEAMAKGLDRPPPPQTLQAHPPGARGDKASREFSLLGFLGLKDSRDQPAKSLLADLEQDRLPGKGQRLEGRLFDSGLLRQARLESVTFVRCRFERDSLEKAIFLDCSFLGCVFETCALDGAEFHNAHFHGGVIVGSSLSGAVFSGSRLTDLDICRSTLTRARFHQVHAQRLRLTLCDLTALCASALTLGGCLLKGCVLDEAVLSGCVFESVTSVGLQARRASVCQTAIEEPFLARLAARSLRRGLLADRSTSLDETPSSPLPPQACQGCPAPPETPEFASRLKPWEAQAILAIWLARRDRRQNLLAHREENARRLGLGRRTLGLDRARFLTLLPLALHADFFDQAHGLAPLVPPCRVWGYHPVAQTLELARAFFPEAAPSGSDPEALCIEAVLTIGSFGTMAQTSRSDLDIWVCLRAGQTAESDLAALEDKLAAMERWALETFGLEAHLYLMDVERVAAGDFGVSHEEGSGSAQSMLLKEELYRTCVLLAGKPPLWWAAPAGQSPEQYRTMALDPDLAASTLDLGALRPIPPDEFFGASIWQIFKSIAEPYKSVMKIGLLESYSAAPSGETPLLCESIKASLLAGSRDIQELDPYARLYARVFAHYQAQGLKEEAALVRLAFLAKSELAAKVRREGFALTMDESRMRRMYSQKGLGGFTFGGLGGFETWGFKEQAKLGDLLSRFIVRAYTRLSERAGDMDRAITAEDFTRLGRRVVAAFSRRKHKVEIMPFAEARSRSCRVIYAGAVRGEKNAYIWRLQGGESVPGEARLELVVSRESRDLAHELAWFTANGVFGPDSQVSADYTINPVTAKDLQELMETLREFFPQKELLHASTAQALAPEAVAKALVAVNLTTPRETPHVKELAVFFQTTWGELFVRQVRPKSQPPYSPKGLVSAVAGMDCVPELALRWFKPARAACKQPFPDLP